MHRNSTLRLSRLVLIRLVQQIAVHDGKVLARVRRLGGVVHVLRRGGQLQRGARLVGGRDREPEVLLHEADAEAALVVARGGGGADDAGDGVVDLAGPAAARGRVDHVGEDLRVETPSDAEVHGFRGRDVVDGEDVVVGQLAADSRALVAQVPHLLAHQEQDGLDALEELVAAAGLGGCAEHEGQGARARADDAAGHGCVDEAARLGRVHGVGDLPGRGRVDGGGVDEEALLRQRGQGTGLEDGVEDVLDVLGFGEASYDCFLDMK